MNSAPSVDPVDVPEDLIALGFNANPKANLPQNNEAKNMPKRFSQGSRPVPPAAPMGVRKSIHKRDKSVLAKSAAATTALQAGEDQSQSESGVALMDEEPNSVTLAANVMLIDQ